VGDSNVPREELLSSFGGLDTYTKNFLEPYITDHGSGTADGQPSAESQLQLDDENLWMFEGEYDAWICRLAESLCIHNSQHLIWPKCALLCSLKSSFSELLFPHLLFEIFLHSKNSMTSCLNSKISAALENRILDPAKANLSAIRTVIHGLEFFNAFRCSIIASSQVHPFLDEVLQWKTCFWFEIPYLTAAKAAMRCNAQLTALHFLERLSSDRILSKTSTRMNSSSGVGGAEELMREAYQNIDESDGNAAFDKGLDLGSVASAYERDEEWWRALGLFDVCMMEECKSTKGKFCFAQLRKLLLCDLFLFDFE
jgi:hypothetical protein